MNIKDGKSIDINDLYKDALLASLCSQLEHLTSELDEKNLFIRPLLILDGGRQGSGYLVRNRTQSTASSNDDSSSQSDIAEVGRCDESVYEEPSNELLNNTDTSNENENEKQD